MTGIFFVAGKPVGQGALTTINRRTFHSNDKDLIPWRRLVAITARNAGIKPMDGPVGMRLRFTLPRPKSVKRDYPTVAPDLDHYIRAIFDALSGVAYKDDSAVVSVSAHKVYGEPVGVEIRLRPVF